MRLNIPKHGKLAEGILILLTHCEQLLGIDLKFPAGKLLFYAVIMFYVICDYIIYVDAQFAVSGFHGQNMIQNEK